ncbi:MAG: PHB depolymerase family esterase [Myxococcota bacterium]
MRAGVGWFVLVSMACGSPAPEGDEIDESGSDTDSVDPGPADSGPADDPDPPVPTSVCTDHAFPHDDTTRFYRLCVPEPLPDGPLPVVMGFHGGGGGARNWSQSAPFDALGATEGFVTLYMQGCREALSDCSGLNGFLWNIDKPGGERTVDDKGYVLATLARLETEHGVEADRDRIYATGHSMGGMFAYSLYCDEPDLLAAIGPMSGAPSDGSCAPHANTALFHLHGAQDENIPFASGCCSAAQQDAGDPAFVEGCSELPTCANPTQWWPSVRGGDHPNDPSILGLDAMAMEGHGCEAIVERTVEGPPMTCFAHVGCPDQRPEACLVGGVDHSLAALNAAVPVAEHFWRRFAPLSR